MSYEADLAYIHDLNNEFAQASVEGLLRIVQDNGIKDARVVDLGCGTGTWARRLVDAGHCVECMDLSREFIQIARRRVPEAKFSVGSLLDFSIPPCDCVTAIGEVINYRFDERAGLASLKSFFRRVYDALPSGGLFLTDTAVTGRDCDRPKTFWLGDDYGLCVEFHTDKKKNRLTREIVTFRRMGKNYRRGQESHELQLYESASLLKILRATGFRVRTTRFYGDFPLPKNMIGFIARKP